MNGETIIRPCRLDPSQDMIALGLANLGSGLLGGLAAGGSLSQSAVNDGAGARSQLSPVIAAALSLVTVLALTPLFTDLPEAVLAAMVIHAVSHLMKVAEMRRFYRLRPREFWLGMITLLGVIVLDVFYANAQPLRDTVTELVRSADPAVHTVILDLDANDDLDITSSEALEKLASALSRRHVRLALVHLHAPARDMLSHFGLAGDQGSCPVFPTLESAVNWAKSPRTDDAAEAQVSG